MRIIDDIGNPVIAAAVDNDSYSSGKADYSVTSLIAPPKIRQLKYKHRDEVTINVSDLVPALFGQALHVVLERAAIEGDIIEERLFMEREGKVISGQIDRRTGDLIQDWKTASVWEYIFGMKPDRIAQLNIYAELARQNGYTVNHLEAVFIYKDWKKREARIKKRDGYPPKPVMEIPVPLWSSEETLKFIDRRLWAHMKEFPDCTDEDRWIRLEAFAVMKAGRKTAVKLFKPSEGFTREDAEQYIIDNGIEKGYVEQRITEPVRCLDWCPVSDFCKQHETYLHG